jgi:DNA invertase Pin-like site-specific DNA recombinase
MVKERADGSPQLNLRVPKEHHDRVRRVVALLRTVERFPARLDELLAIASEPVRPSFLDQVVNRIERLEAELLAQKELTAQAIASPARKAIKPAIVGDSGDSGGRKRGLPLTDAHRDEVLRLIETHPEMKNPEIGKALGISKETVRRIRQGIR